MLDVSPSRERRAILSPDVRLAFAPSATYAQLLEQAQPRLWQRVATAVLVIAVAAPIIAVQRVTIGFVALTAVSWSFVVGIQATTGALVIASARTRRIRMPHALDLWFAAHVPYTLWLLTSAVVLGSLPSASADILIALAVVPSLWTAGIVSAFCRVVLGTTREGARLRAAAHFAIVWIIALEYVAWSAGGWFQITRTIARVFE